MRFLGRVIFFVEYLHVLPFSTVPYVVNDSVEKNV